MKRITASFPAPQKNRIPIGLVSMTISPPLAQTRLHAIALVTAHVQLEVGGSNRLAIERTAFTKTVRLAVYFRVGRVGTLSPLRTRG